MEKFGNDWMEVSEYISTRTPTQARSHAQKYYQRLEFEEIKKAKANSRHSNPIFVVIRHYLNRSTLEKGRTSSHPDSIKNEVKLVDQSKNEKIRAAGIMIPIPCYPMSGRLLSLNQDISDC